MFNEGENEPNGIDSNTPLESYIMTINAFLQADEDDAGHKGLQNFEETWDCGQKSTYLTRFGTGQPNLNGV